MMMVLAPYSNQYEVQALSIIILAEYMRHFDSSS